MLRHRSFSVSSKALTQASILDLILDCVSGTSFGAPVVPEVGRTNAVSNIMFLYLRHIVPLGRAERGSRLQISRLRSLSLPFTGSSHKLRQRRTRPCQCVPL